MGEQRYVTLMSSLPYHGRLFGARQTPLSRFQLNQRLAWLEPGDAITLEHIERVLRWRHMLLNQTDSRCVGEGRALLDSLEDTLLAQIVLVRLQTRTLIAALRMRKLGQPAPEKGTLWGIGRWVEVIRRHWSEPDFGLGRVYPWVTDAWKRLERGDALGVERVFLGQAWADLARMGAGHYFDLVAVVVYVLRWDLIDRWTHYDSKAARGRILGLADAGLGRYGHVFN